MLLKYEFNNFTVFKENIEFSMKPGKVYARFSDNVIKVSPKIKVSKVAVIAGENGSGKTCFMTSLDYLKYIIETNNPVASLKKLCNNYEVLGTQKFKIVVLIEKKIYTYELEIDRFSIVSEKLSYRGYTLDESKDSSIFYNKRGNVKDTFDKIELEFMLKADPRLISSDVIDKIDPNSSGILLNHMKIFKVPEIDVFVNWIRDKLIISMPSNASLNIYKEMQGNELDLKIIKDEKFLEIFQLIDPSIVNIEIDEENPFMKTTIIRIKNGKEFRIRIKDESSGVGEFFAWAIQIWRVIYEDVVLFADEIDRVLNPIFAKKVLAYIKGSEHKGQFIFSTHNILHLNTIDFMKEQIYFASKDPITLESELYSLADFKDYRYEKSKVYEIYLKGLLGGVPNA